MSVTWDNTTKQNMNIDINNNQRVTTETSGWNNNIQSTDNFTISSTTDVTMTFKLQTGGAHIACGIGKDPYSTPTDWSTLELGMSVYSNYAGKKYYDNGTTTTISQSVNSNTVYTITVVGTTYTLKIGSTTLHTKTLTTGDNYYVHCTGYNSGGSAEIVSFTDDSSGSSGGGSGQMYSSSASTPHNESRPLQIFKSQRSWF